MKFLNYARKRGLALFMALVMCLSLLPAQAMAEGIQLDSTGESQEAAWEKLDAKQVSELLGAENATFTVGVLAQKLSSTLTIGGKTVTNLGIGPKENVADVTTLSLEAQNVTYTLEENGSVSVAPDENEPEPTTYTVTYTDGAGGTVFSPQETPGLALNAQTPAFNTTGVAVVDENGKPTRTGYTFAGWAPAVAATVTGDVTYTAQWEQDADPTTYTVTYTDGEGGTVFSDQTNPVNAGAATPAFIGTLERTGYTFVGWLSSVDQQVYGTTEKSLPGTVTSDVTYTAQWTEITNTPPTTPQASASTGMDMGNSGDENIQIARVETLSASSGPELTPVYLWAKFKTAEQPVTPGNGNVAITQAYIAKSSYHEQQNLTGENPEFSINFNEAAVLCVEARLPENSKKERVTDGSLTQEQCMARVKVDFPAEFYKSTYTQPAPEDETSAIFDVKWTPKTEPDRWGTSDFAPEYGSLEFFVKPGYEFVSFSITLNLNQALWNRLSGFKIPDAVTIQAFDDEAETSELSPAAIIEGSAPVYLFTHEKKQNIAIDCKDTFEIRNFYTETGGNFSGRFGDFIEEVKLKFYLPYYLDKVDPSVRHYVELVDIGGCSRYSPEDKLVEMPEEAGVDATGKYQVFTLAKFRCSSREWGGIYCDPVFRWSEDNKPTSEYHNARLYYPTPDITVTYADREHTRYRVATYRDPETEQSMGFVSNGNFTAQSFFLKAVDTEDVSLQVTAYSRCKEAPEVSHLYNFCADQPDLLYFLGRFSFVNSSVIDTGSVDLKIQYNGQERVGVLYQTIPVDGVGNGDQVTYTVKAENAAGVEKTAEATVNLKAGESYLVLSSPKLFSEEEGEYYFTEITATVPNYSAGYDYSGGLYTYYNPGVAIGRILAPNAEGLISDLSRIEVTRTNGGYFQVESQQAGESNDPVDKLTASYSLQICKEDACKAASLSTGNVGFDGCTDLYAGGTATFGVQLGASPYPYSAASFSNQTTVKLVLPAGVSLEKAVITGKGGATRTIQGITAKQADGSYEFSTAKDEFHGGFFFGENGNITSNSIDITLTLRASTAIQQGSLDFRGNCNLTFRTGDDANGSRLTANQANNNIITTNSALAALQLVEGTVENGTNIIPNGIITINRAESTCDVTFSAWNNATKGFTGLEKALGDFYYYIPVPQPGVTGDADVSISQFGLKLTGVTVENTDDKQINVAYTDSPEKPSEETEWLDTPSEGTKWIKVTSSKWVNAKNSLPITLHFEAKNPMELAPGRTVMFRGSGLAIFPQVENNAYPLTTDYVTIQVPYTPYSIRYVAVSEDGTETILGQETDIKGKTAGETILWSDVTPKEFKGYKLKSLLNDEIALTIQEGQENVIKVLYEKDLSVKHSISAKIEYYTDGKLAETAAGPTKESWIGDAVSVTVARDTEKTFKGYDFANTDGGNADGSKTFTLPANADTNDRVENVLKVYYNSKETVTLTYVSSSETMGSTSPGSETLNPETGVAKGSVASPEDGYEFVNWTDERGNVVCSGPDFVPSKAEDALWVSARYIANFRARGDLSYTVNYLEKDTDRVLHEAKEVNSQTFGATINISDSDKIAIDGYNYDSADKETLTITTGANVIRLYYTKRADLKYTVNYLEEGTDNPLRDPKVVEKQRFGTVINASEEIIPIEGYYYKSADKPTLTIGTNADENVLNIYYTKNKASQYTIQYYYDGVQKLSEKPDERISAEIGSTILVNTEMTAKGIRDGYKFSRSDPAGALTISETGVNIIKLYYVLEGAPELTVTAKSLEVFYDGTEKTVSGFEDQDESGTITVTGADGKTYRITGLYSEATAMNVADSVEQIPIMQKECKVLDEAGNDVTSHVTFHFVPGHLTIKPRTVTLTSESEIWDYDGKEHARPEVKISDFDGNGNGFVSGEGYAVNPTATGKITDYGYVVNEITDGTLNANTKSENYTIVKSEGMLCVRPNPDQAKFEVTVTAKSGEFTYDGAPHTVSGFVVGDQEYDGTIQRIPVTVEVDGKTKTYYVSGLSSTKTGINVANSGETAISGNVQVWDAETEGKNVTKDFLVKVVPGKLTIKPRAITLTSGTATQVYSGTALTAEEVTATLTDKTEGEAFVGDNGATYTYYASQLNVGSCNNVFTYQLNDGTLAENYAITTKFGTLEVTGRKEDQKYSVIITAGSDTVKYDGNIHTVNTFTINDDTTKYASGTAASFTAKNNQTYTISGITAFNQEAKNVVEGGHNVTVSGDYKVTDANGNDVTNQFKFETKAGTLTITPRQVTLTSADDSKPYDGRPLTNHTVTVGGDGFVEGEGVTYSFAGSQTLVGGKTGNNTFSIAPWNEGTIESNYTITLEYGTLTVTERPDDAKYEITVETGNKTVTYNGREHTLEGSFNKDVLIDGRTYTVHVKADDATGKDTGTYRTGEAKYTVTTLVDGKPVDVTKQFTVHVTKGTLTINKRPVTLTSPSASKEYDGTPLTAPEVTIGGEGFVGGEVSEVKATGTVTNVEERAKTNTIEYTFNTGYREDNYAITKYEGTLQVFDRSAKYEVTIKAVDASAVYDGEKHSITKYSIDGEEGATTITRNGQTFNIVGMSIPTNGETNAGTYTVSPDTTKVTVTDSAGTNVTNQFCIVPASGMLTITPRPVLLESDSASKVYDGTALTAEMKNPSTTANDGKPAFIGDDGASMVCTPTGSRTLVGFSPNTFDWNWKDGTADTTKSNYAISVKTGTLTVTNPDPESKYQITVKVDDLTVTYDGKPHKITDYSVVGSDSITVVDNHTFYMNGEKYTIEGLSVNCEERTDAEDNPATATVTGSCTIKDVLGNDVSAAFNVTHVEGTLTITRRPITLRSGSGSKVYDGTPLSKEEVTVEGTFAEGEGFDYSNFKHVTFVTAPEGEDNTFKWVPKANTKLSNYDVTPVYGKLIVRDRSAADRYPVTVKRDGKEVVYNGREQSIDAETITQTVTVGEGEDAREYTVTVVIPELAGTDAGTYSVDLSKVTVTVTTKDSDGNDVDVTAQFDVDLQLGNLRINKKSLTITTEGGSMTYSGQPLTNPSVTVDGLENGETLVVRTTGSQTAVGSSANTYEIDWTRSTAKESNYQINRALGQLVVTEPTQPPVIIPTPTPTPTPTPVTPTPTPTPGGTTITDEETPLGGAVGLNDTDHYAYIAGYEDDTVRPTKNISRAEVATIFFRLMTEEFRVANWATENTLKDVLTGDWYNNAVSTCANAGIITGYSDGRFQPQKDITRAEFAVIAARFLGPDADDEGVGDFSDTADHWAAAEIRKAAKAGWITGDGNKFRPNDPITRAEVMVIVNRMLDRTPDAEHMLPDMKTWIDNPEGTWYYEAVQEATNGHDYERDELNVETWTAIQTDKNWKAIEAEWAANNGASAPKADAEPVETDGESK